MDIHRTHYRGFTVIELIVGAAVCTILMAGVAAAMGAFCRSYAVGQPYAQAVQNVGVALVETKNAVRGCSGFTTSETSGTGTASTTDTTRSSSLLITPPVGTQQAYRVQNGQLRFYGDASQPHVNPGDIKANSKLIVDCVDGTKSGFTGTTNAVGYYFSVRIDLTITSQQLPFTSNQQASFTINDSVVARRVVAPN